MANIAVILGSTREGRNGIHVAKWITKKVKARGHKVSLIDPKEYPDAQILEVPRHYGPGRSEDLDKISAVLDEADGFILVTPEYNHSFSGAMKNLLDNFMPEYEKKPFGIASYSASPFGGIRANEALRQVVSELKGVPTPIPFMVSTVHEAFGEEGPKDKAYEERIIPFLEDFEWYVKALKDARK